jgi:hypothetical protein
MYLGAYSREHNPGHFGTLVELGDIIGPDDTEEQLREAAGNIKYRQEVQSCDGDIEHMFCSRGLKSDEDRAKWIGQKETRYELDLVDRRAEGVCQRGKQRVHGRGYTQSRIRSWGQGLKHSKSSPKDFLDAPVRLTGYYCFPHAADSEKLSLTLLRLHSWLIGLVPM